MVGKRRGMIVAVAVLALLLSCATGLAEEGGRDLRPQLACCEAAQDLLNAGDTAKALATLEGCVEKYPDSDWLRGMYGRVLFKEGRLRDAEEQFRKALEINKKSPVAKILITEVREVLRLLEDPEEKEWLSLIRDKIGDLGVIVAGVWLGMLMTLISERFAALFKKSHFDKALRKQDWNTVTDILENLIANWRKRELRAHMAKLLEVYPQEKVEAIIVEFVDYQQHEDDLLFFVKKMCAKG